MKSAEIMAILSPKGGVGKSLSTAILAHLAALAGKFVVAVDGDPQPGLSTMFARHRELLTGQTGIMSGVKRAPMHKSLMRLVLEPEKDLDGLALEFPMPAGHPGQLALVPNAGDFETLVAQLHTVYRDNRTQNPDLALAQALTALTATRATRSKRPMDMVIIDTPGARDQFAQMVYNAVDHIIIPLTPTNLALDAAINAIDDIAAIRDRRGGFPHILPVLPNAVKTTRQKNWIRNHATPLLNSKGIQVYDGFIPYSEEYDEAINAGVLPFEFAPLRDVNEAFAAYYRDVVATL